MEVVQILSKQRKKSKRELKATSSFLGDINPGQALGHWTESTPIASFLTLPWPWKGVLAGGHKDSNALVPTLTACYGSVSVLT